MSCCALVSDVLVHCTVRAVVSKLVGAVAQVAWGMIEATTYRVAGTNELPNIEINHLILWHLLWHLAAAGPSRPFV